MRYNPLTKSLFFVACIFLLSTPASAIIYEANNPRGLGLYNDSHMFIAESGWSYNISIFNYTDGNTIGFMNEVPDYLEDACIGKDGEFIFTKTYAGNVYKYEGVIGGYYDFSVDPDARITSLSALDSLNMRRNVVVDPDGNIYAHSYTYVYIFSYPDYEIDTHCIVPLDYDSDSVYSLGWHKDGLLIGMRAGRPTGGTIYSPIYQYNGSALNTLAVLTASTVSGGNLYTSGIASSNINDIYFTTYDQRTPPAYNLGRMDYADSYNLSYVDVMKDQPSDMLINSENTIYVSSYDNNTIETFTAVSVNTSLAFDKTPYLEYDVSYINWDISDYVGTHANEIFKLVLSETGTIRGDDYTYTYYLHDLPAYTTTSGQVSHQIYNLVNDSINGAINAHIYYSYNDPVYHETTIGESYISTDILSDNYTYEPPEPEPTPTEPEIPDPTPTPTDPDAPPVPTPAPTEEEQPTGTYANQTINTTWTGEYYNLINGTVEGLFYPLHNFTNYTLTPIYMLNDTIGTFNTHLNDTFTESINSTNIMGDTIYIISNIFPNKIKGLITYYLVWLLVLIIMKKS